ncbi:hypothetical protein [Anaerosolibacter sp.]|uniref:hypothetical protein n=1 Tax=Anaerosolibacter sp. TaxID=1872527 RepID=UPI0039EEEF39
MARPRSYTHSDLTKAAAQAKREITNKIKKGSIESISKSEAFDRISRILKLKSSRTLWEGESFKYLDEWSKKLESEIESTRDTTNIEETTKVVPCGDSNDINDLLEKINMQNRIIKAHEAANDKLREENNTLRKALIGKYGPVDM